MNEKMPRTPFSTPLSGSAHEVELRIKNIVSGPKKRPPALFLALVFAACILCGNLVSCQRQSEPALPEYGQAVLETGAVQMLDYVQDQLSRTQTVSLGEVQGKPLSLELEERRIDWLHGFQVDYINVRLDGELIQTLLPPEYEPDGMGYPLHCGTLWLCEGLFDFSPAYDDGSPMVLDLNFDGCMDFGLMAVPSYSRNLPYVFYLWDPEQEQFDCFGTFNYTLTPDPATQVLTEVEYGGNGGDITRYYVWNDMLDGGRLDLIREEHEDFETYYYAESVLRDGHWYNRLNIHIYELEDGRMVQRPDEVRYYPAG